MTPAQKANCLNVLGAFLGMRDVPELTPEALQQKYGLRRADVMVLFGGSILCGGDVLAEAMKRGVARKYVIVGGEGHTTQTLRDRMHGAFPGVKTQGLPEAQVFSAYLRERYGLAPDLLECDSTNCGNNVTYLLRLLRENGLHPRSIILSQDATMQRRMDAGMRRHADADMTIVNFATYAVSVVAQGAALAYERAPWGMWSVERYASLLLGEIPRLTDDANGYGPKGKDFIAHVDIPQDVRTSFEALRREGVGEVRDANPLYASKDA